MRKNTARYSSYYELEVELVAGACQYRLTSVSPPLIIPSIGSCHSLFPQSVPSLIYVIVLPGEKLTQMFMMPPHLAAAGTHQGGGVTVFCDFS